MNVLKFLLIFMVMILCGCESTDAPKYKIGVSQCSSDEWRDKMNEEIMREMLFHDDAIVEIRSADDSNEKQISDIQYYLDNNFDIIIVAPNESEAITPIIKKAYEGGTPVIIFDRRIQGDSYTSYIDLDNRNIGVSAAEYTHSLLNDNDSDVIEITGLPGSSPARERHEGFMEGLKKFPKIHLLASEPGNWERENAYHLTDSLLELYPDVRVIFAHNDFMALGIDSLLREKGRRDIKVLGTDASPGQGMPAVREGKIDATFIYPTEGHRIVNTAFAILNGESYEKTVHVPALTSVDKSNADILLRQYELLKDETDKVMLLEDKNMEIEKRHNTLSRFLNTVVVLAIVLGVILILLLILFIRNRKLQKKLKEQNRNLEEERDRQKELYRQLDDATNSKLAFFTNVSHDLRTPLTLISEPVEQLASRDYISPNDSKLLKLAVKNTSILRRLIDDILDFQKYESGAFKLNIEEVKIVTFLRERTFMFKNAAEKRSIMLEFRTDCDENFSMGADVEKLERVFFNLLSNALRYTRKKGKVEVGCKIEGNNFIFTVKDTGQGIRREELDKIFDNFFRSDDVKPKGSGIGLAVTRDFVTLHGGEIGVESEYGKGSEFKVSLPIVHSEAINAEAVTSMTQDEIDTLLDEEKENYEFTEDKPLLLIIDDNSDIRQLLRQLLEKEYNVISAEDGRKGVRLAMRYVPDLILCDIMMPEMDGIECCGILKKESATSHIPVLMLTACKLDEQKIRSYENGADGYISKPFNGELLLARCANLIANRKRIKDISVAEAGETPINKRIPDKGDSLALENDFYRKFLNVIHTRYKDITLNTESMGEELNLGGAQLTRKIKALTGYSPVEILRTYRLEEARKLIISTDTGINEITHAVGFTSPAYFTKCFHDHYGKTPTEMRNAGL